MKKLVVLTGAGISAESGLKTFRDSGGLWENFKIEEVASIEAWYRNPEMVLDFYNARRKQADLVKPNRAHRFLVELEDKFDVEIITQNVDDLHERAGSSKVLHLHGRLKDSKCCDISHEFRQIIMEDLRLGQTCSEGHQLRPDIVWFGEDVPKYPLAIDKVRQADILLVIGTSLQVYPAANLAFQAPRPSLKVLIDPNASEIHSDFDFTYIAKNASESIEDLRQLLF